jgi:molybdopterin molybdotransferase
MRPAQPAPITVEDALAVITRVCRPLPVERASGRSMLGRVLAEDVRAPEDMPAFDRSAMDGYALRPDAGLGPLEVVDRIRAGDWKPRTLTAREAVRVATGAALPAPHLVVVPQEDVEVTDPTTIRLLRPASDDHVRRRGEDAREGALLLPSGTQLGSGAIALLASLGHLEPKVYRLPRIAHWVTGDELVAPHLKPPPGRIRETNSTFVAALLAEWGFRVDSLSLPEELEKAWSTVQQHDPKGIDVLLISGGASVGEHDATGPLLDRLGYRTEFWGVRAKPGRPLLFASAGTRIAFGLPGNPLSHWACLHVFVRRAFDLLVGKTIAASWLSGQLVEPLDEPAGRREIFWPGQAEWTAAGWHLKLMRWSNSGDMTCLATANALVRIPADTPAGPITAPVQFLSIGPGPASLH